MRFGTSAALAALLLTAGPAKAVLVASDDASQAPYANGWQSGDNGGSGWGGAWTLSTTSGDGSQNGHFIGDSTSNGSNPSGGINTGSSQAWGLYANSGQTSAGVRPFANALTPLDTFSIDMDNGFINGTVGFGLQNSSGENLFEFFFVGGQDAYTVRGDNLSGSPPGSSGNSAFNDDGMRITFSLTDSDSFEVTVDDFGNDAFDFSLSGDLLSSVSDIDIEQVRVFNFDAGGGGSNNAFFNNISISSVPEVSPALALPLLLGGVFAVRTLRRRPARAGDLG